MKKLLWCGLVFTLAVGAAAALDLNRSMHRLLISLSRQYVESEEEVFFKRPTAVLPFESSGPLAERYDVAAAVEELLRRELSLSTYFLLTERKNLERILEEVELSLTDFASSRTAVRVGEITGASLFFAGSVSETGDSFLISVRIIDVERALVLAVDSVQVPKEELIAEARSYRFRFVERQGLGMYTDAGLDFVVTGLPWKNRLQEPAALVRFGGGVSYRIFKSLQLTGGFNTTWTDLQMGEFDPTAPEYGNTGILTQYYTTYPSEGLPTYSLEYSQRYLHMAGFFVWNPLQRLTISIGGGGLVGLWSNMIKLSSLPVPLAYDPGTGEPIYLNPLLWTEKNVVLESGNGALYGLLAALKLEYFVSPRVTLFLNGSFRKTFAGDPYRYTFGGLATGTDETFFELSQWEPNKTPHGDSLIVDLGTVSAAVGVSFSF